MTLCLYPSSPQLEPGEHCVCTQHNLWVLSRGTLCYLGLRETEAAWQGQPTASPCTRRGQQQPQRLQESQDAQCAWCQLHLPWSLLGFGFCGKADNSGESRVPATMRRCHQKLG